MAALVALAAWAAGCGTGPGSSESQAALFAAPGAPALAWSPSGDLGTIAAGQATSRTFTLVNPGSSASAVVKVALAGSPAFSVSRDGCTAISLGPSKTCSVTVAFAPTVAGQAYAATLTATINRKPRPTTVSLALTGGTSPVLFGVSGTVSLLHGDHAVVLQDNGADDLSRSSNGSFTFGTRLAAGAAYSVTVRTQPSAQETCVVENGSGIVAGDVTDVRVTCVTELPVSSPFGIAAGPDGNLWITGDNAILRMTPAGVITEFPLAITDEDYPYGPQPLGIAAGPDGNLWFTEGYTSRIGRITPAGAVTEFAMATGHSWPSGIAAGPDGNLWFTTAYASIVGRMTTAGALDEFALSSGCRSGGIAAGPDGNLWFTEGCGSAEAFVARIGRITTAGAIDGFVLAAASSDPEGMAAGPDGNLWFTDRNGGRIGRITPAGVVTEFDLPTASSSPWGIAAGPDGNLWFTEMAGNRIGRITPGGVLTEFPLPTAGSTPLSIVAGPDGSLWFTERDGDKVGRITP